jgi:hypothetical protein
MRGFPGKATLITISHGVIPDHAMMTPVERDANFIRRSRVRLQDSQIIVGKRRSVDLFSVIQDISLSDLAFLRTIAKDPSTPEFRLTGPRVCIKADQSILSSSLWICHYHFSIRDLELTIVAIAGIQLMFIRLRI